MKPLFFVNKVNYFYKHDSKKIGINRPKKLDYLEFIVRRFFLYLLKGARGKNIKNMTRQEFGGRVN